jgi:sporulation protein YlmC with PRC-barrel domain
MRHSDDNLRGRTIIAADGQVVGEVAALFLDSEAWRVESLQVKLGKDVADHLGVDRSMFHAGMFEVPVSMVQSVGDTIVLSVPIDGLREVLPMIPMKPMVGGGTAEGRHTTIRRPYASNPSK